MITTWLFDLDGTLIDTAPELADALNATLRDLGLPPADEALVRSWIGDGARALLSKALGHAQASPEVSDRAWPRFSLHYAEACGTRSTVHAGVRPMLDRLRASGGRLAVLTNKEAQFAHRVLAAHALTDAFEVIVAGDTLPVRKPHPGVVQHTLQALDAAADEALLIGDSLLDVRCARAAGIPVWLVRHGYPAGVLGGDDRPDAFIDHFDQVGQPPPPVAAPGRGGGSVIHPAKAVPSAPGPLPRRVLIA